MAESSVLNEAGTCLRFTQVDSITALWKWVSIVAESQFRGQPKSAQTNQLVNQSAKCPRSPRDGELVAQWGSSLQYRIIPLRLCGRPVSLLADGLGFILMQSESPAKPSTVRVCVRGSVSTGTAAVTQSASQIWDLSSLVPQTEGWREWSWRKRERWTEVKGSKERWCV